MWNLTSGATTPGITPNAVTASITFSSGGGGLTDATETGFGVITFPTLNAGDVVWIVGKLTCNTPDAAGPSIMRLRDSGGNEVDATILGPFSTGCLVVQTVFVTSSTLINAQWGISVERIGGGVNAGSVSGVRLVGLRLQR
jgi:hypothetical protein